MDLTYPYRRSTLQAVRWLQSQIQRDQDELERYPLAFRALTTEKVSAVDRPAYEAYVRLKRQVQLAAERLAVLRADLEALNAGRLDEAGCADTLLSRLNRMQSPGELDRIRPADPMEFARKGYQRFDPELARRIIEARDTLHKGRFATLDALLGVRDVSHDMLDRLMLTHCGKPFTTPAPAEAATTIGVMLPARLETRFYPPSADKGGSGWRLRLRIIPDEPFFDRHDPVMTAFEAKSVDKLLASLPGGRLRSKRTELVARAAGAQLKDIAEEARIKLLWQQFAELHGGARAAWLVRQRLQGGAPPGREGDEQDTPHYSQLRGLPSRLEVWMQRTGQRAARIATLHRRDPGALLLDIPLIDPDDRTGAAEERWWSSFQAAQKVGLAAEIDLGTSRPDDIEVIYVVGLGDSEPAALFRAHADSGRLGVMAYGEPTNSIDGAAAADLGQDPEIWRRIALGHEPDPVSQQVSLLLTGRADALGALPGAGEDDRSLGQALLKVLWLPLWGHALKDVWGLGSQVHRAGVWAIANLLPEGPLPPLRLGDLPYGVLPVTSLKNWRLSAGKRDPGIEEQLRPYLLDLRRQWAGLAEQSGTVAGAGTEKVLELMARTALSGQYAYRGYTSLRVIQLVLLGMGVELSLPEMDQAWTEANVLVEPFLGDLAQGPRLATLAWPVTLRTPLVLPPGKTSSQLAEALRLIASAGHQVFEPYPFDGLLFLLGRHARLLAAAEVVLQRQASAETRLVEPDRAPAGSSTWLFQHSHPLDVAYLQNNNSLQAQLFAALQEGLEWLADALAGGMPVGTVERALRATLDTAIYRVDPWITGYAWRRLRDLLEQPDTRHRLGLYGWVDRPRPGNPGPTAGGLLHAPSTAQAVAAAILRDKVLHDPPEDRERWQMDLESDLVRQAERLASQVREGVHLWEALGREVERIVADRGAIDHLRARFPISPKHGGRRVCHGQQILDTILAAGNMAQALDIALNPAQEAALRRLGAAVDAYGDLLVAQAVYYVVSGRAAIAGATMDAAAGLAAPPTLEVLHTPGQGRGVRTAVLVALPVPPPAVPSASPGRLASPALAAFLASEAFRQEETWTWRFSKATSGRPAQFQEVSLDSLGLEPVDTLALSAARLANLAQSTLESSIGWELAREGGPALHARAVELVSILGSQPALLDDVTDDEVEPANTMIVDGLRSRYSQLRALAQETAEALLAPPSVLARKDKLRAALRWGITPMESGLPEDLAEGQRLAILAERAAQALLDRLAAAPDVEATASFSQTQLATAIAELASPEGKLAILSHVELNRLPGDLVLDGGCDQAAAGLDAEWLSVVAAVRPRLAQLEAFQLESLLDAARSPLCAWTNRPADPWQTAAPPADDQGDRSAAARLVVIYGPHGVLDPAPGKRVALGLLDRWSETIPDRQRSTTAAMGFQAPAARPPQAILLAVPPRLDQALDTETLVAILDETRELLRARMATSDGLLGFRTALPMTLLPEGGETGVLTRVYQQEED